MTTPNCLDRIILARWCKPAAGTRALAPLVALGLILVPRAAADGAPQTLANLVRPYRQAPTPARRAAIESYAAAHPKEAAQARLALGITAYEQKDYASAIANLRQASAGLAQIADYAAYYLGASRVDGNDLDGIAKDLEPVHTAGLSPLAGKAWLVEARALKTSDPQGAVRLLRDHYSDLPQPDGDVTLADSYQVAGDLANAADFYQRVYHQYLAGDAATHAAAALLALKDALGTAYPEPLPEQKLRRADRLFDARLYAQAQTEYQAITGPASELVLEQARVRAGAAQYLAGHAAEAYTYLSGLDLAEPEAGAERLFYMVESARHQGNDSDMNSAVERLSAKFPKSLWRLKALLSAANRYLLINQPDTFVPLYKTAYTDFPEQPAAALSHWKVAFQSYLENKSDAADLLREHLKWYALHPTAPAALYFLGRLAEQNRDFGAAKTYYQQLVSAFENYYYALLARDRLRDPQVAGAAVTQQASEFLSGLAFPQAKPLPSAPTAATKARIDRAHLLRGAGLNDLADGELRFGARTDGQPALLAMEIAASADSPYQGLRAMKSLVPDYLGQSLASTPRQFWESLFPLPYRTELTADATSRRLDPFLVAGLIRQESEFNPAALSHANAYGLTQVRPATGRQYARQAGLSRFSTQSLLQPAANLKIGTSYLRGLLDQHGGSVEQTLAAYNAGPARAAEWLMGKHFREPAEFVESIPFTETRDYVQAVLRNADIYRRLYH
ncbi:MAG TPA: transglycosylase SLT domain-containing protein [Bryobacteraceae bacterium]|nr:transglycosylase SLT domain-containing protein [Bryobacteraceae bacterium]